MSESLTSEFLGEAKESLDTLERELVAVDQGRDPSEVVAETFRAFHSLKGTAAFLGFDNLRDLAHGAEDVLERVRAGALQWTRPVTDLLLEVLDALRAMLEEAEQLDGAGEMTRPELIQRLHGLSGPKPPTIAPGTDVRSSLAAAEMTYVTQGLVLTKAPESGTSIPPVVVPPSPPVRLEPVPSTHPAEGGEEGKSPSFLFMPSRPTPVKKAARPPAAPPPEVPASASMAPGPATVAAPPPAAAVSAESENSSLRVPVLVLDRLMNLVGELVLARNQLRRIEAARDDAELAATSHRIDLLTAGLQEGVTKARMQPVDAVLARLPRVVRDTAALVGKQVRLVVHGQDTELDKTLLEAIKDPLTHVVRNAVDHGIENAEVRATRKKAPEGTITIRAAHDGGQVVISVSDDGGGVALERVRKKAVSAGLIGAEDAARMGERETLELLFRPGFSTAEQVTQISGRGVGMDVVRTNLARIGGTVELKTKEGEGTTCVLRVPLTLVIVPTLTVLAGGHRYAIPQASLAELVRIDADREHEQVIEVHGVRALRRRGVLLPLLDLGHVLGGEPRGRVGEGGATVVVLTAQGRTFGVRVDDVEDTEEVVVKPLSRRLQGIGLFAGATVRGDGRVALVLDVVGLAKHAKVLSELRDARADASHKDAGTSQTFLVLGSHDDGRLAIALSDIARLEELDARRIERVGGGEAVQYRGRIMPIVRLGTALGGYAAPASRSDVLHVVVRDRPGGAVGIVVDAVHDVVNVEAAIDAGRARPGIAGCSVIQGRITEIVDTDAILRSQLGEPTGAYA